LRKSNWLYIAVLAALLGCAAGGPREALRTAALYPNLHAESMCRVRLLTGTPERGSVVLISLDQKQTPRRIVGMPGDTISVKDGALVINKKSVAGDRETKLRSCQAGVSPRCGCQIHWETVGSRRFAVQSLPVSGEVGDFRCDRNPDLEPIQVPSGQVFVLADNRDGALDSRHFGPISIAKLGKQVVACLR
jgi:signal peptidase I